MGASNPDEQQQQQAGQGEYDFSGQPQQQQQASTVGLNRTVAKRAPKWMGRPCGVAFGFGGKFVSFNKAPAQPQQQQGAEQPGNSSTVSISSIPGDDSLVKYAKDLTQLVSDTGKDTMVAFCEKKKSQASSKQNQELWEFMKMLYEGNTRGQLLKYLGYEPAAPEQQQQQPLQEEEQPSANGLLKSTNDLSLDGDMDEINKQLNQQGPPEAAFNDEDFFDNLQGVPSPLPSPSPKQAVTEAVTEEAAAETEEAADPSLEAVATEDLDDVDTEIKHALFVANYAKAVEICLEADKMADALLIASLGGADLWAKTQKEYVKKNSKGYMKVLLSIMDNNLKALVQQQHPQNWRETLALLCTYAQSEEWPDLCSNLGDLLLTRGGDVDSAVLCYVCAGNLDNAVRLWSQNIDLSQDKTELNLVMEKAIVLSLATEQQSSQAYGDLLNMYADLLASSGQISEALDFLNCIPGELSESTTTLKERLSQAGARLESAAQAATTGGQDYAAATQQQDYSQQQGGYASQQQDYSQQQGGYSSQQGYNSGQNYSSYGQDSSSYGGGNYQNTSQYNSQQPAQSYSQPSYDQSQYYQQPPASQPAYDQQYQQPGYGGGQAYVPSQPAAPAVSTMTPMENAHQQQQQQPALFNPMAAAAAPSTGQVYTPQGGQAGPPAMGGSMGQSVAAPPSPKVEAKPAAPRIPSNISIASADVSQVAADLKPVIACLTESYNICAKAYEGNPGKKREVDDNSRRLGILFFKLNMGDIKPSVKASLLELCKALSARDFVSASKIHISLTTTDFDECGQWLTALKRIIKTRQQVG
jgi:protein transport protein SEC31